MFFIPTVFRYIFDCLCLIMCGCVLCVYVCVCVCACPLVSAKTPAALSVSSALQQGPYKCYSDNIRM